MRSICVRGTHASVLNLSLAANASAESRRTFAATFSGLKLFKMIMETDALRKILRRFKVSDFNEILKRWPYLRNRKLENISSLKRKIELVNRVLEIAKVSIIKPIHYFPIMVTC